MHASFLSSRARKRSHIFARPTSQVTPEVSTQLFPGRVGQDTPAAQPAPPVSPEKPATVKPLAPACYKVEFTASEQLRDKLKRLEALMSGHDLAEVMEAAVP